MKTVGIVKVAVDGNVLRTNPNTAKVMLGGVKRNPVGVHGFAEEEVPAELECEISLGQGESLEALRQTSNATIQFETDTGQTYVIREAFLEEAPAVSEGEGGKIPLKFFGKPADEVL